MNMGHTRMMQERALTQAIRETAWQNSSRMELISSPTHSRCIYWLSQSIWHSKPQVTVTSPREITGLPKVDRCSLTTLHWFKGRFEDWEAQDGNPSRSRCETRRQYGRSTLSISNDCFCRSNGKEIHSSRDFKTWNDVRIRRVLS